jgi:ATP-binding cassette subfamily B (MDR/TAP) protein 1
VQVFENLKAWRRNRTTIVITHDLSQIVSDDFVYVMRYGIVSEQGFRSDLMIKHPAYGQDLGVFASMAAEQAVEPVPIKWEEQATLDLEMMEDEREVTRDATLPGMPSISRRASNTGSFAMRPQSMACFDILDEYARGMRTSGVPVQRPAMGRKGSSTYLGQAKPAVVTAATTVVDLYGGVKDSNGVTSTPGRGMTAAQKRLSWGPQDLNPKASRALLAPPSAYANMSKTSLEQPYGYSRPGSAMSNRPGSRMSVTRQGSFECSPYSVTVTPNGRPVATRQQTLSQGLDDELDHKYSSTSKDELGTVKASHEHAIAITDEDKGPLPGIFRVIVTNLPLMPKKWLFVLGLFGSVGHGVTTPVWASYLSRLMSIVAAGGTDPMLTTYAIIVLAICVAQAAANYIQLYSLSAVAAGWSASIRSTAYQRVLVQDKAWFDRPGNAPAVLVQNLIKDADDMRAAMGEIAGKILVFVSMVTLGVVWAMVVQWRLTLVGLAIGPVFVLVVVVNEGLVGRAEMRNKDMRDRVGKMFYEVCIHIPSA